MKKNISIIILLLALLSLFLIYKFLNTTAKTSKQITTTLKDTNIVNNNGQNTVSKQVKATHLNSSKINVNKDQKKYEQKTLPELKSESAIKSVRIIKKFNSCIVDNHCKGMKSEGQRYFDPNNTSVHRMVSAALDLYEHLLIEEYPFAEKITSEQLLNLSKVNNYNIRFTALNILSKQENINFFDATYQIAKEYRGKSSRDYLSLVSVNVKKNNNEEKINNLINYYIKNSDNYTLSFVAKSILDLNITVAMFKRIEKSICAKNIDDKTESGKMILEQYNDIAHKVNLSLKCLKSNNN